MHRLTTNRMAWGQFALLAGVVLGGVGLLIVKRVEPNVYAVARDHGPGADLRGAFLVGAALRNTDLFEATLDRLARFGFRVLVLLTGHYPPSRSAWSTPWPRKRPSGIWEHGSSASPRRRS